MLKKKDDPNDDWIGNIVALLVIILPIYYILILLIEGIVSEAMLSILYFALFFVPLVVMLSLFAYAHYRTNHNKPFSWLVPVGTLFLMAFLSIGAYALFFAEELLDDSAYYEITQTDYIIGSIVGVIIVSAFCGVYKYLSSRKK